MNEHQWTFEPIYHDAFNIEPQAGFLVRAVVPVINLNEMFGLQSIMDSTSDASPKYGKRYLDLTVMKEGFDLFLDYLSKSRLLDEVDSITGTNITTCEKFSDLRMVKLHKQDGIILVNFYTISAKPIISTDKPVEGFKFNYIKE